MKTYTTTFDPLYRVERAVCRMMRMSMPHSCASAAVCTSSSQLTELTRMTTWWQRRHLSTMPVEPADHVKGLAERATFDLQRRNISRVPFGKMSAGSILEHADRQLGKAGTPPSLFAQALVHFSKKQGNPYDRRLNRVLMVCHPLYPQPFLTATPKMKK